MGPSLWMSLALMLPLGLTAQYAGGQGRGDAMAQEPFTPCEVMLPVEWLYFSASCIKGLPSLEWATASERNTTSFVVERATGMMGWETIDRLAAAEYSTSTILYASVDKVPSLDSVMYYRLRQEDSDGSVEILPTAVLWHCGGSDRGLQVFPNPAGDVVQVSMPSVMESHRLELADAVGSLVRLIPVSPAKGSRTVEFPLVGLAAGTYHLVLRDGQGNAIAGCKIMKQ